MGRYKEESEKKKEVKYTLEFHPEAGNDIEGAWEYYELQRAGLGEDFILSVEATLNYISRNPLHFQKIFLQTRHCLIKRFPFAVYFIVLDSVIYITTISNLRRNPKIWKTRKKI